MSLQVLYITVQFPVPSETFAAVEIRALRAQGLDISVATLKPAPPGADAMLRDHGLADLEIDHNSLSSNLRGLLVALRSPRLLFRLLKAVFTRQEESAPKAEPNGTVTRESAQRSLLKDLTLIPRSLDLFDRIRRNPPDVVHLYWGHYPSLLGLLVQEHLEQVAVSLSLSAYDLHSRYGPSLELAGKVPLVFTLAQANKPAVRDFGVPENRIQVVYHGIDTGEVETPPPSEKTLEVLIVERLVRPKGTAESLQVFRQVLDRCPAARLTIVGDGPERAGLETLVKELGLEEAVTFLGRLSHEEVFAQFSAAKVLLSMSISERLPNTVKEAMLRGCIPIVARTLGIDELISHEKTGFIVEQGGQSQAAEAITRCLADWDGLSAQRAAAQRHIRENFSSSAVARKRQELWLKAIETRH